MVEQEKFKRTKVFDRWQNILQYCNAMEEKELAAIEIDGDHQRAKEIYEEKYDWLISNFNLTPKRKKQTIFQEMINKKQ